MRALVIFCHPNPESYCAHLKDQVLAALATRRADWRLLDLYAMGFDPVMGREERLAYRTAGINEAPVREHLDHLLWADTLIFVYPTWWFNLPAMLKGWLDRVLVPHVTFRLPSAEAPAGPLLTNVTTVAAITTCGARHWQSKLVGEPGKKTLLRGVRLICHPRCRTRYAAIYRIDMSTHAERVAYSGRVRALVEQL